MQTIIFLILLLVMAELFEAYIQRSQTLLGVLKNLYLYYHKSIFLFFLVQPSFYILLFIVVLTGVLNLSMVLLLALKVFDIFYKLELIRQVFIQREISIQLSQVLLRKVPPMFFLIGSILYPLMLFYALA